jgi:hypothetical protein
MRLVPKEHEPVRLLAGTRIQRAYIVSDSMATYFRASKDGQSKPLLSRDRVERLPSRPKLPPRIHLSRTKSIVESVEPDKSTERGEKQVNWGQASEIVNAADRTDIYRPHTARHYLFGNNNSSSLISRRNLLTAAGSRKNLFSGSRKNLLSGSSASLVVAGLILCHMLVSLQYLMLTAIDPRCRRGVHHSEDSTSPILG